MILYNFVSRRHSYNWSISFERGEDPFENLHQVSQFIYLYNFGRGNQANTNDVGFTVVVVTATDSKLLHQNYTILSYLGTQKKIRVLKKLQ